MQRNLQDEWAMSGAAVVQERSEKDMLRESCT